MALQHTPITDAQKTLPSGAVIPSGEANFYDLSQSHENAGSSGINATYPSPSTFVEESGALKTYRPEGSPTDTSSIFNYGTSGSQFSNAGTIDTYSITDFSIFNDYIHYATGINGEAIIIPYVSTYTISPPIEPYPLGYTPTIILNSSVN